GLLLREPAGLGVETRARPQDSSAGRSPRGALSLRARRVRKRPEGRLRRPPAARSRARDGEPRGDALAPWPGWRETTRRAAPGQPPAGDRAPAARDGGCRGAP